MIGPQRVDADQDQMPRGRRRRVAGAEHQSQGQAARRAQRHATAPRVDSRLHDSQPPGARAVHGGIARSRFASRPILAAL
jgi:hypothetical protein